nr:RES family NAD+ phosphorylase [Pectobacterium punjabense]
MYSSRFFNKSVENYFSEIVSLAYHHVEKSNNKERLAVSQLAKGSKLYRARKILIDEREDILAYPAQRLGPAPYNKAANNRMSAESISMLYLAKDQETSISEMRPSMGDVLAVGEFITTKDLVFFDFYKIEKEIQGYIYGESILFKRNERQYIIEKILPFIGNEICRPANNPSRYIASQALAEVIKNFHNGKIFDGIIFKSVQNDAGVNYVIFNKSQYKESEAVSCEDFFVEINRDVISFNRITSIKYKSEEA